MDAQSKPKHKLSRKSEISRLLDLTMKFGQLADRVQYPRYPGSKLMGDLRNTHPDPYLPEGRDRDILIHLKELREQIDDWIGAMQ